jgi:predicted TIM-barrel fold metal-dependent hydrolase
MIIDIHAHITYKNFPEFTRLIERPSFDVDVLLKRMDLEGIDKSVLLPLNNPENLDYYGVAGNQEVVEACRAHPDRLIPFCNIDPRSMLCRPGAQNKLRELIKIYKDQGCVGIGEICASLPVDHPLCKALYRAAELEKMPMIFHFVTKAGVMYGVTDSLHLPRLEKVLQEFPRAIFIGHSPAFWNEIDGDLKQSQRNGYLSGPIKRKGRLWDLMEKYSNLCADTSAGSGYMALSRDQEKGMEFLQKFNKKLFFGTDRFSSIDEPIPPIIDFLKNGLKDKKLTKAAYENIMHKNFERVFKYK